ncbi:methyl-accepting chemotaxis protein [Anaerocolumna xylanovorans]|uniref:Methyl-accepting chemotaxis sensory transducer with TarH sensor n=1 Tax=Anaerocolumna xylanovorans DSM 12503 TaxID=1121345 RepID=A0A1M7Y9A2_9FIRM|nr:methyl-accepting chemotaxis protein [Anaerocolumna xylanovorans]SHO49214.1 methyl-accepting chemotaxis sensory transducer with TarH sensor [Anaerocolumna xylanovorans DSM 12503]
MVKVKFSIKSKLILLFLSLSLIPFITALIFMYQMSVRELDRMTNKRLNDSASMVNYFLEQKSSDALSLAKRYLQNSDMIEAFREKDRDKLLKVALPIYENLSQDAHVTVFELGDDTGTVFVRAHNKDEYGDSKADNVSIKAALSGQEVRGLEFGKSGLAIRAFLPIKANNTVIGTLQIGFDDTILTDIQASINGNISLYNGNVLVKTSSDKEKSNIGKELSDSSIYERVKQGQKVQLKTDAGEMILYYPLYDTLGTSVEGIISISQDISDIERYRTSSLTTSIVLLFLLTLGVTIIAYLFAVNITNPIHKAVELINRIARFNLSEDAASSRLVNRTDEMGVIARSISDMRNSLRTMIEEMAEISQNITKNSKDLFVSAEENTRTINQVAVAISEIAIGNGGLSETISNESLLIEQVTERIGNVTEIISDNSLQAAASLEAVEKGQSALLLTEQNVDESISTTAKVNSSLQELIQMIKQVTNISSVISSIASQTNLLALNAAIEAARAGEAGKGFSVVAEEIRKLAEETASSLSQITVIVGKTVSLADEAGKNMEYTNRMAEEQKLSVNTTKAAFENISTYAETIAKKTKETADMLSSIDSTSKEIRTQTQDMAAVAEESAAGSEEISASSEEQLASVEMTAKAAADLSAMAEALNDHIVNFQF